MNALILFEWRPFDDDCPYCGDTAEVFTSTGEDNKAFDGEEARCIGCKCPGGVVVDEDGNAYIDWHDEPKCECEWCKTHPDLLDK